MRRPFIVAAVLILGMALLIRDWRKIQALEREIAELRQIEKRTAQKNEASTPPAEARPTPALPPTAPSTGPAANRVAQEAAVDTALEKWLARVNLLKQRVDQTPEWKTPEMDVLVDEDWLYAVYNNPLVTEKDYQHAYEWLKNGADTRINLGIVRARIEFLEANGRDSTDRRELLPYLPSTMHNAVLSRPESRRMRPVPPPAASP